jgi:hypothetical protein
MIGMPLVLTGVSSNNILGSYLEIDIAARVATDDKFAIDPAVLASRSG